MGKTKLRCRGLFCIKLYSEFLVYYCVVMILKNKAKFTPFNSIAIKFHLKVWYKFLTYFLSWSSLNFLDFKDLESKLLTRLHYMGSKIESKSMLKGFFWKLITLIYGNLICLKNWKISLDEIIKLTSCLQCQSCV